METKKHEPLTLHWRIAGPDVQQSAMDEHQHMSQRDFINLAFSSYLEHHIFISSGSGREFIFCPAIANALTLWAPSLDRIMMTILLDIDGVLVTTPAWRSSKLLTDGFFEFNEKAVKNLAKLINETKASIVLTTTHRFNYSVLEWRELLKTRGINPSSISKVNELTSLSDIAGRSVEIKEWINLHNEITNYVIIDDDLSLNGLPLSIKQRCVLTKPLIGLDDEATEKALTILLNT